MNRPAITVEVTAVDPSTLPADLDLTYQARKSPHSKVEVAWSLEELQLRTALTSTGSGTGDNLVTTERIRPSTSFVNASWVARTVMRPGVGASEGNGGFNTRPSGTTVSETGTYTEASTTTTTSGALAPLRIEAWQTVSRQWLRQTNNRAFIRAELEAAAMRRLEIELAAAFHAETRISETTTTLSATVVNDVVRDLTRETAVSAANVIASPIGATKLIALRAATFDADWQRINGVPLSVSPGIGEAYGVGTNETEIYALDFAAGEIASWGAWTLEDPFTYAKKGLIEMGFGMFVRPIVARPWLAKRIAGVATT